MDKNASSIKKKQIENKPKKKVLKFKVVVIGDVSVGKTSVLRRLLGQSFNAGYCPTICVDLATYIFNLDENRTVKMDFVRKIK
jgi:GTPase SAR1 family protein